MIYDETFNAKSETQAVPVSMKSAHNALSVERKISNAIALLGERYVSLQQLDTEVAEFAARYYGTLNEPLGRLAQLQHQLDVLMRPAVKVKAKHAAADISRDMPVSSALSRKKTVPAQPKKEKPQSISEPAKPVLPYASVKVGNVKQLYYALCRFAHPDAVQARTHDERLAQLAHGWMQQVNEVYVRKDIAALWKLFFAVEDALEPLGLAARGARQKERCSLMTNHAYELGIQLVEKEEGDEVRMMRLAQHMAQLGTPMEEVVATQLEAEIETAHRAVVKAQLAAMAELRGEMHR